MIKLNNLAEYFFYMSGSFKKRIYLFLHKYAMHVCKSLDKSKVCLKNCAEAHTYIYILYNNMVIYNYEYYCLLFNSDNV